MNNDNSEDTKTMPVLFLGGPHDGKRIELERLPSSIEVAYSEPPRFNAAGELGENAVPLLKKAHYRREAMRCSIGLYPLYVFSEIPAMDIVHLLLEGYRESEEDRKNGMH